MITYENLRLFAYVNDRICKKPVRGIVLSFFGLGCMEMYEEETEEGKFYAENGILFAVPYNNPWAWMNRQTVRFTDEIVNVLFQKYALKNNTPVISTGGSMGGQSALVYAAYAERTPAACVVNCPVCDLVYSYGERKDVPRTLYSAFYNEEGELEEILSKASPLHLAESMPAIVYRIFHCDRDEAVNISRHSACFVSKMKDIGRDIIFETVHGRGHCDLTPEAYQSYRNYILQAVADNE